MVVWIEGLGIVSGGFIYIAMLLKNLPAIKALLLLGAIGFLTYGIILGLPAIITVNSLGALIGIYGLFSSLRKGKHE